MRLVVCAIALIAIFAVPTFAQIDRRIPIAVVDARGFFTNLGEDATTADNLGIPVEALPGRGLGAAVGAHVYLLRRTTMALGVGGEFMFANGSNQPEGPQGDPIGDPIARRIRSFAAVVSLNFGRRDGWSYLAGGMGPLSYVTFIGDAPPSESVPKKSTINMGGGARWFFSRHLAFGFDVRFYLTRPEATSGTIPGRARQRLLVLSAGLSIK